MADEEDFLSRWSRRKRSVAEETPAVEAGPVQTSEPLDEPESEEDEAELLERLGLPVPETLKEGDDFSGFMQAGVPQFLRKRALRVLWRSNPVLANLDGLNDYDDDFRTLGVGKVVRTAYEVGKGMVTRAEKAAEAVEKTVSKSATEGAEADVELQSVNDETEGNPDDPEPSTQS
mgnify:CR=1 FL=1